MKNFIYILFLLAQLSGAQTTKIVPTLKLKAEKVATELTTNETNHMDPVSVNATLVWSQNKTQIAVVMKVSVEDQWHIYAYVPKTQPYITSELQLELPKGISAIGEWEKPYSEPYDNGVYVYHDTLVFVQYCSVADYEKASKINCGLYYQTCDKYKCFPPETKTKSLKL
ncbi:protein-disulfide reductase DsbD domain-containing protein [Flavivirga rizhaonensis]|uniref:Thiol:disulfide interchange protein DsbD N-terminal domain-containing protein n=1 Tax=Flavivirga rizhaonensis TaxID=2559571 RepID=A0A4S1E3B6_9FLAO|nr:protein-disulfide reductase DsbD domain-containing protein [Flavivirga rizhaonensis]TGV04883.1 hypothetical protein EM932_01810 [Flavivirga rizhaonensis]